MNGKRKRGKAAELDPAAMTLMEHLRELRSRLFKASIFVVIGFGFGFWLSSRVLELLYDPYCSLTEKTARQGNGGALPAGFHCEFVQLGATDGFVLRMQIALWVGLILAAPFWLYQLWAFIAPGLHKHERRWAYWFAGIATPLFAMGAVLAFFVVKNGLDFLLQFNPPNVKTTLEIRKYVSFITNLMLLFGVAFEFPLVILLLNFSGLTSGRKMLGWWRVAVFLFFLFAAIATPTADPFGMSFLGLSLTALYFLAVGVAMVNDRRKRRRLAGEALHDDEASPLDLDDDLVLDPLDNEPPAAVAAAQPLDSRYDDMT
jgi:sec-independent protein translocase protein TatC